MTGCGICLVFSLGGAVPIVTRITPLAPPITSLFLRVQVVGLLLAKGAQTMYKNVYGNSPLKVVIGSRSAAWIKRVQDGGEPERHALAEELKASREEELGKASGVEQALQEK